MIYEYALEPELAASWHDFQRARYFKEKFGIGRGRLVSRYPKRWKALVWQAFDNPDQNAKKRLEALLTVLTRNMVARGSPYSGGPWFDNAEKEHTRSQFHAILARANPTKNPGVVLGDAVDEESEPLWVTPSSLNVPRDADRLAEVVAPMLRCASKVIFVDPHFKPMEERFRRTLGAFFAAALKGRPGSPPDPVELHVDADKYGRAAFELECKKKLPPIIPVGVSLRIIRLKQWPRGQELHNRFILTDIGGVSFGHGLDESDSASRDHVSRLEEEPYLQCWRDYDVSATPAFDREEPPLLIRGERTI